MYNLRISLCSIVIIILTVLRQVHIIQLNSYNLDQQLLWYKKNISLFLLNLILLISLVLNYEFNFIFAYYIIIICLLGILIENFPKKQKKKLVFTARIKRLIFICILLHLLFFIPIILNFNNPIKAKFAMYAVAFSPIIIFIGYYISLPIENSFRRKFMNEAKAIIDKSKNLYVIGITGSFGKTSVKYFLNNILSEKYRTCMTPESYNTSMGATLTIKNYLKSYDEIFICEMGARRIGDVKEICDIVSPNAGIITDVGAMHLDTFKTIENVARCKTELAESVYNKNRGGAYYCNIGDSHRFNNFVLVNGDNPYIMNIIKYIDKKVDKSIEYNPFYITYGKNKNNDYYYDNVEVSENGTSFDFCMKEISKNASKSIKFETKLLGEHNIMNLVAAITMAKMLGVDENNESECSQNLLKVVKAVKNINPVEHRLSLSRIDDKTLLIDDAFNSNPKGSINAINVLNSFNDYKKIIITPGMVELGDKQKELNENFGKYASDKVDYALVVGNANKESLMKGFSANLGVDNCLYFSKFEEAFYYARNNVFGKKVILLENDLTDNY